MAAPELEVVPHVDLGRYLGKWYEIARIEHGFQKGCINSAAQYSLRDDGDIKVVNSCEIAGREEPKVATARAWVTDKTSNAKLRVQFVLTGIKLDFLSGRYWIIALGEDYDYAMVGEPGRDYLWILARSPDMPEMLRTGLVKQAADMGYDVSRLIYNAQIAAREPDDAEQ
ncbi:lipocalin family protein [Emcibacter sp.]|uniref:lipocalin family protein n=1 Tax=Emcibacter sp. TaxID=1979954 RepID=UPI002AA63047|nr:lipocalin family protein [Emcibacter sp.]